MPGGRAPLLGTVKEMELVSPLKRLHERHQEGGFLYRRLRKTGIKRLWEWNISFGLHNGNLRHLVGRARPVYLLGRDLYLIYFSVMCNLEVCGLIFDHKTLRDISVWALRGWISGSRHFAACLYREPAESCPRHSILFLKGPFNLALCTRSSSAWSFSFRLHTRTMLVSLVVIRATYPPASLVLWNNICEEHKS